MNDKTKTYTLKVWGCEVLNKTEQDNKQIRTGAVFLGGWTTFMSQPKSRIKQIIFSPTGFKTDKDIAFDWAEVKKISITNDKKAIGFFGGGTEHMFVITLSYKENLINLIKTFCSIEILYGNTNK